MTRVLTHDLAGGVHRARSRTSRIAMAGRSGPSRSRSRNSTIVAATVRWVTSFSTWVRGRFGHGVNAIPVGRDPAAEALVVGGLLTAAGDEDEGAFGLGPGAHRDMLI
jgi:hypothetical protein